MLWFWIVLGKRVAPGFDPVWPGGGDGKDFVHGRTRRDTAGGQRRRGEVLPQKAQRMKEVSELLLGNGLFCGAWLVFYLYHIER